jgi:hypothetical protein
MSKTILLFFCLTFLYSWTIWILSGLYFPESDILVLAGAWGPTLAGLLLAFKSGGTDEVKSLPLNWCKCSAKRHLRPMVM